MTRWLISVPVWGARCVDVFCAAALPALEQAVLQLIECLGEKGDVRIVVHTDSPARVRGAATQAPMEFLPVPVGLRDFDSLSQAHREVLSRACSGDVVVLLTADLVISRQGLAHCARALENKQKKLVLCATIRARQEGRLPDCVSAPELARWAWEHRHWIAEECRFPAGRSADLSRLFFERGGAVRTRQALPHPLAVRIDGRLLQFTPTIDANLGHRFGESEIYYARDAAELALVELSPADKGAALVDESIEVRLPNIRLSDPFQRWCFSQPVDWVGAGNCGDDDQARLVLALREI